MRSQLFILTVVLLMSLFLTPSTAQVPITVYGHVYMPDGSPAVGASVTVKAGGSTGTTTTDSNGFYKVDLTVSSVPVSVKVTAKKGDYRGSASKSNVEGAVQIDVRLKKVKRSTSISISVAESEFSLNETVVINGRLNPAMVATVYVYVIDPSKTTHTYTTTTSSDGRFSINFKANMLGQWKAYASFPGNDDYLPSTSSTIVFYVRRTASLEVNVEVVNGSIILKCNSTEDITAPLDIYVSIDNGTTWIKVASHQLSHGSAEIPLNLTIYGKVLIKVYLHSTSKYSALQQIKEICIPSPTEAILISRIHNLTQTIENLNQSLIFWKSRVQVLEENLTQTIVEYEEAVQELEQIKTENMELKGQISQLQEEKSSLQQSVSELSAEVEKLKDEVSMLRLYLMIAAVISLIAGVGIGYFIEARKTKPKIQK